MNLKIKEIENKKTWEDFLSKCKEKTFLQSWNWGEFQRLMGNKIWRLGAYENQELISIILIAKIEAKRGKFLLVQHGPNIKKEDEGNKALLLEALLRKLKEIGRKEKTDFIRMAPLWERNKENNNIFKKLGFRKSPIHANAYESTWKLDISFPEEKLLIDMRKTTRYLIRQALKNPDIAIKKSENLNDIEIYQKLNLEVAKRQKFIPFPYNHIKNEFSIFSKDHQVLVFFGLYKNEPVSAALVVFWSGIAFYHQAASDGRYAKFSIPYLLLWEAIREAKKRNCLLFDFWGYINPEKNPKHPWAGPSLFKRGFGGQERTYMKTQDFPLSGKYWFVFVLEKLRKQKRGL